MQVIITLDKYDGSQGKSVEVDLENFQFRDMLFYMMQSDVCGFTVSKADSPAKMLRKLGQLNGSEPD